MKVFFRILTVAVMIGTGAIARAGETAPAAQELTDLLRYFLDGASRNDVAAHERFWADDLVYTRSAGVRIGKAEILEGLRAEPETPDEPPVAYSAEDIRIRQYGETAVVAFRLVGKTGGERPATEYFLNTGTFVKRDGEWRAVAWQATREAEPEGFKPGKAAPDDPSPGEDPRP